MAETVKAREHQGSQSLDLTLTAEIREEYDVEPGDVFRVGINEDEKGRLEITYTRVFAQAEE